ncbi:hypothetical protein Q757_01880 [Oenococcus alcoholitolerans]|uniref:50S ribosomal protein L10 n=1 Tax=Oenococcus alcoholitolerans TaxID=931074 RepID=A0ABR4XS45_9LACO|nr:hypothetical protein Q757_01880 [Oenococcus alcoholitolerans]
MSEKAIAIKAKKVDEVADLFKIQFHLLLQTFVA